MTTVEVEDVAKAFGGTPVLAGISMPFPAGSFTSLLGPSGSGKTTLLRIIAGFLAPDRGRVSIGGTDVTGTPVWARNIGMVFQSYALFPHMSVADNIAYGLRRRGMGRSAARREVERALDLVQLPGFGERRPKQLSGGQQQRVALARAVVTQPSVLLLDEPLSALDRRLRQEMQVELARIQRSSGLTTVFVTHDQEEAMTLSDRVAILDRGVIVQIGAPSEVYERPRTRFAAEFLGDANFLTGRVSGGRIVLGDGTAVAVGGPLPANGTTATVAVRPEKIALGASNPPGDDASGDNRIPARIESAVYAGSALTYVARGSGLAFKVFAQNRDGRPLGVGTPVELRWSAAHTIMIENGAG